MTTNEKALLMHEKWNGKLETVSKTPVKTREDLAIAYTPGVAEPCKVIAQDKEAAYKYTMKANTCSRCLRRKLRFLVLATSVPTQPCPLWKARQSSSKNSVM